MTYVYPGFFDEVFFDKRAGVKLAPWDDGFVELISKAKTRVEEPRRRAERSDYHQHPSMSRSGYNRDSSRSCGHPHESSGSCGPRHESFGSCGHHHETPVSCGHHHATPVSCGYRHESSGGCGYPHESFGSCGYPHETPKSRSYRDRSRSPDRHRSRARTRSPEREPYCKGCGKFGHEEQHCPANDVCFKCEGTGHRAKDCPSFRCYRCNEQGHIAAKCPKQVSDRIPTLYEKRRTHRDRMEVDDSAAAWRAMAESLQRQLDDSRKQVVDLQRRLFMESGEQPVVIKREEDLLDHTDLWVESRHAREQEEEVRIKEEGEEE